MQDPFHTYLLAQIIGLYMIIMPIILFNRRELYCSIMRATDKPNLAIMVSANIGLVIGLVLVDIHNIWAWRPLVVVTIICWFILIKAILWLAMPERMLAFCKKKMKTPWVNVQLVITGLLGIYLLTHGFFAFSNQNEFPFNLNGKTFYERQKNN